MYTNWKDIIVYISGPRLLQVARIATSLVDRAVTAFNADHHSASGELDNSSRVERAVHAAGNAWASACYSHVDNTSRAARQCQSCDSTLARTTPLGPTSTQSAKSHHRPHHLPTLSHTWPISVTRYFCCTFSRLLLETRFVHFI